MFSSNKKRYISQNVKNDEVTWPMCHNTFLLFAVNRFMLCDSLLLIAFRSCEDN